jgi:hypothetical protein
LFAAIMPAKQLDGGRPAAPHPRGHRRRPVSTAARILGAHLAAVPWAAAGVLVGYFALGHMDEHQARLAIGAIVVSLPCSPRPAGQGRSAGEAAELPRLVRLADRASSPGSRPLVSNAAGPSWSFICSRCAFPRWSTWGPGPHSSSDESLQIPVHGGSASSTGEPLLNLMLAPAVIAGTARAVAPRPDQPALFENIALGLTLVAGIRMLL